MLTIELRSERHWPVLTKAGLAGLGLAGLADVIAHGFGSAETAAHLGAFVSMVLVLLGVVADGVRTSRARSRARTTRKEAP